MAISEDVTEASGRTGKFADAGSIGYLWLKIKNAFSSQDHTHKKSSITDLPTVAQTGEYKDLINKPTIPTIPSSLPANGGNADTVGNYTISVTTSAPAAGTANNIITFVVTE